MNSSSDTPISTAVVTGGHDYEVVDFHRLFRSLDGVDAYIQHMDDFVAAPPAMRNGYEVVLFFTMLLEGPRGEHLDALEQISAARQGVVVLHHSILAFPYSAFWRRWTDLNDLSHSVDPPEPITTEIAAPDHPITSGLADWDMVDEIYRMGGPSADSHILLATRHPHSMPRAGVGPRDRRPAGDVLSGGSRSSGLDPPQLPHHARAFDPVVRRPHLSPQSR